MAENSKGGILNKADKFLRRRKTKVLQSLGKTGRTTDDKLAEDCILLEKQLDVGNKLQKDLKTYLHSAKALSVAAKTLYTTVGETYEAEWDDHEAVSEALTNMDMLWQDYLQKLHEQVQEPLVKYLAIIPQIKARVSKQSRKLIDYDNARHNLEVLQNAKKKDNTKIAKAQEELDQAKKIYEDLNGEVHQELPEFYHSRVKFYGDLFQSFFDADSVFHSECGKAASVAQDASYRLAKANEDVIYEPRSRKSMNIGSEENLTNGHEDNSHESPAPDTPTTFEATSSTPVATPRKSQLTNGPADADTTKDSTEEEAYEIQAFETTKTNRESENVSEADVHTYVNKVIEDSVEKTAAEAMEVAQTATRAEATVAVEKQEEVSQEKNEDEESDTDKADKLVANDKDEEVKDIAKVNGSADQDVPVESPPPPPTTPPPADLEDKIDGSESDQKPAVTEEEEEAIMMKNPPKEALYEVPPPAKPVKDDLPERYKYTVMSTHAYKGEDDDELTFDSHEVIYVVEYEDPEEQKKISEKKKKSDTDPGWLMGVRKSDRSIGVFPENFTKKV